MDLAEIARTRVLVALIGFIVYLIVTYVPMPDVFKTVITVICAVLLILWVISMVAGGGSIGHLRLN